ncbi:LysR family transcriptional regulator [Dictyobacter arantiisoli]|uniref:HTH lysR-type domain-containing protein n=1 Tax=Dictyobacter arantiisoli TaxID=2014874 RepID=A0A5A5TH13_9CHLR|nr:LysR family transcriptional regulator [Dictyobacter arantiisoli]GCF10319.1 hypothetical protein KDI_38830 [Dictyobacter arantiisoli]
MDTEQLITFEQVVREGSFSRAARTLNLSQPTMSTRIQALEEEIGGPLFVRGGRKVTLTERGESFLPYARRALEVLHEGREVAQLTQEGQRGRITIGTIESYSTGFLAATIANFHRSHPEVEIFVRTGHSNQIEHMLYDGVVKLGLISWPFLNPDLTEIVRFREPLVFVAPPGHPLTQQQTVTAEDIHLLARPLLIVHHSFILHDILARIYPHPERTMELPAQTACELLRQGVGAAFIARTVIARDLAAGHVVELQVRDIPASYLECALVRLARNQLAHTATNAFVTTLADQAGTMCIHPARNEK